NLHAIINIDYDSKGQRTRVDYGNGALTEYGYDDQTFRLIRLKTSRMGTSVYQDLFYAYDPAGNITHIRDDAQQTIYFNGQVVLPHCDYAYDAIYRLINATGREHIGQLAPPQTTWNDEIRVNLPHPGDGQAMRPYTEQYLYDAVGNFEKLIHQAVNGDWTRAYAYNEASLIEVAKKSNRLSSTRVGATTELYTYDAHGNMTGMSHLALMLWDFKDQLSATARQVVNAGTPETTFYIYDGTGQRVRKVTERQNGSRKGERIYLGGFEIYHEFNGEGTGTALERETLHIMDDKRRIALVETRSQGSDGSPVQLIRYQFGNHLGSVSLEMDDDASVISYEEYTPYGSTSSQAVDQGIQVAAKRYRYTGKERDDETGLAYHGARYYAAWLGRWTSHDPIWIGDGVNILTYVHNKPTGNIDGNGHQGHKPIDDLNKRFAVAATTATFKPRVTTPTVKPREPETGSDFFLVKIGENTIPIFNSEAMRGQPTTTKSEVMSEDAMNLQNSDAYQEGRNARIAFDKTDSWIVKGSILFNIFGIPLIEAAGAVVYPYEQRPKRIEGLTRNNGANTSVEAKHVEKTTITSWGQSVNIRGEAFEAKLAMENPEFERLPTNFKTFDLYNWKPESAISAKSYD